jgi:hypothetical protein
MVSILKSIPFIFFKSPRRTGVVHDLGVYVRFDSMGVKMKRMIMLVAGLFIGTPFSAKSNTKDINASANDKLRVVEGYLNSLDIQSRQELGSKLYYSNPYSKPPVSKNLLDELQKRGRVKLDETKSTGPRTTQCD